MLFRGTFERMKILHALPCILACAFAAPQGDLSAVLRELADTRGASFEVRRAAVAKLLRIRSKRARQAALDWYRREKNPHLRARFLEHAATLPGVEKTMLAALEKGTGLDTRAVAARYFVEQRGNDGLDLCAALLGEDAGPLLHRPILIAFGWQGHGTRGADLFKRQWELEPPTTQAIVLKRLCGRPGAHLESAARKALTAQYLPLRAAAMRHLAQRDDVSVVSFARKLVRAREAKELADVLFDVLARSPTAVDLPRLGKLAVLGGAAMRPRVRALAARIAKQDWARSWAVGPGRTSRVAGARELALGVLELLDGNEVQDALYDLASDPESSVRRRAILALAKRKDVRITKLLEKQLGRGKIEARVDALEALDQLRGSEPGWAVRLVDMSREGPVELRLVAIELGARRGLRGLLPLLPKLLASSDWRVRAAGTELAKTVRDATSIPILIAALKNEKGRVAADIKRALQGLSRIYFERASDWDAWWQREKSKFELPPVEEARSAKAQEERETGRDDATSAVFYGIPVRSERIVYCLDVSGSMSELAGTGISRMRIAQETLLQTLAKSPSTSLVNVLFFDNQVHRYARRMKALRSAKVRESLAAFVRRQKPLGGTNLYGALREALVDKRVDTVFVLSDGDPSTGDFVDPDEIADDIRRRNRTRRVVFHCIAIGTPSALLERLAVESGGQYVLQK